LALQFGSEFFNVLNHTNFGIPGADNTSAAFGTIRVRIRRARFSLD
jgi:hypothetical protein